MKIGIDGRYQGQPLTGVPRYVNELCKQLDLLLPTARFFVYALDSTDITLPSDRWILRTEPRKALSKLKSNLWWKCFAHRLVCEDRVDVLWCGTGLLPGFVGKIPCVLTVHDITFKLFPETVSLFNLWAFRLFFRRDVKRAHVLLANSEGTSRRVGELCGRRADAVVRPDASPHFQPASIDQQERVRARYGLPGAFFLAVSTLEPRKNFSSLINAFLELSRRGKIGERRLVLTGKRGWHNQSLAARISENEAQGIVWLGFIPDDDLPALYSACEVFCMPSLYEGFGMPVLEARRCGARVVATDIPELREAGDDETVYCGTEAGEIADAIIEALDTSPGAGGHPERSWQSEAVKMVPYLVRPWPRS